MYNVEFYVLSLRTYTLDDAVLNALINQQNIFNTCHNRVLN